MASLQFDTRSGRWRIRFYYGGTEYKRSIKTKSEQHAQALHARVEETIRFLEQGRLEVPSGADPATFILSDGKRTQKVVAPRVLSLGDLFDTYRKELTEGAKEKNTRHVEEIHARHLLRLLGSQKPLTAIQAADIQRYVDQRSKESWHSKRIKPQTIKKEIDTLQTVWAWARRLGHASGPAPTAGTVYPRSKEKQPFQTWAEIDRAMRRTQLTPDEKKEFWDCLFLSATEVTEVLEFVRQTTSTPWLYPLFVFAAHTGARKSEMLRSEIADFKFDEGMVLIREKKRKKGSESTRRVELTPLLSSVMQAYLADAHPGGRYTLSRKQDEPLLETTAHEAFHWVLRDCKWKVLRGLHAFRHSFASNLAAAGIDQRVIDEFMGHQTEAMRQRYRHLFPDQRRKAIQSVFAMQR